MVGRWTLAGLTTSTGVKSSGVLRMAEPSMSEQADLAAFQNCSWIARTFLSTNPRRGGDIEPKVTPRMLRHGGWSPQILLTKG